MRLIMSDRPIPVPEAKDTQFIDLSALKITNCTGCYGCWTRTPGKCVIRDDAVRVYPLIAKSERVLYISRVKYGSYDTTMKTMLERAIPIQQAFIRLWHGETHHVQRNVVPKQAVILGYGDISPKEQEVFRELIRRNANNMNFKHYRVLFVPEDQLEQRVKQEVLSWDA